MKSLAEVYESAEERDPSPMTAADIESFLKFWRTLPEPKKRALLEFHAEHPGGERKLGDAMRSELGYDRL